LVTVAITGAGGYIGSILCERLLAAGHKINALDDLSVGDVNLFHLAANPNFKFTRGDARDKSSVKSIISDADVIIPLAALVGAPICARDPERAESTNFGAIQLVNQLRSNNQLVVYPNSNSGYGTQSGESFCTEETPLEPISVYGVTKVNAENLLLDSPNVITFRLATVFGTSPRMRTDLLVNNFTHLAVTDGYVVIYQKDFKRNYVHVRDVADCFAYALENSSSMIGRPYNLGLDSANLSKAQLAELIKEQVPNFYIHYAEVGEDPDKRNYIVSNERLRKAGFEASRSVESGVEELITAYRMIGPGKFSNG